MSRVGVSVAQWEPGQGAFDHVLYPHPAGHDYSALVYPNSDGSWKAQVIRYYRSHYGWEPLCVSASTMCGTEQEAKSWAEMWLPGVGESGE
jgi:hypothetical protein